MMVTVACLMLDIIPTYPINKNIVLAGCGLLSILSSQIFANGFEFQNSIFIRPVNDIAY